MNRRLKFLRAIRDFFNIEAGVVPPKWLKFIYYVLFPTHYIIDNQEFLRYDAMNNKFYIWSHCYSGEMLYYLSREEINPDLWFRIIKRENGVITIEQKIFEESRN